MEINFNKLNDDLSAGISLFEEMVDGNIFQQFQAKKLLSDLYSEHWLTFSGITERMYPETHCRSKCFKYNVGCLVIKDEKISNFVQLFARIMFLADINDIRGIVPPCL